MTVEYSGNKQISLTSKTYFCLGDQNKQVSKGVCIHQNPLTLRNIVMFYKVTNLLPLPIAVFAVTKTEFFHMHNAKKVLIAFTQNELFWMTVFTQNP